MDKRKEANMRVKKSISEALFRLLEENLCPALLLKDTGYTSTWGPCTTPHLCG